MQDRAAMKTHAAVPFVDTSIIPDRNAGIGSLLWDLQSPRDPDRDGPPLLDSAFAFIDVGVSRARTATALKALLASDLGMNVDYVATELPEAVPFANVSFVGDRGEKIRGSLSAMISSREVTREVTDWHCVVNRRGKVSSIAYSYPHHENEVWEAYFMGRAFMVSGEPVEFRDPSLQELLAPDVAKIEAGMDLESYRVERDPLAAGLAAFGITLQATDVPRRLEDRQNVLFLGNVLNHYPQGERARELDRIAANMQEGDLVIVQVDEVETAFIEVLQVKSQGTRRTRERVRWIDTRTLEVHTPGQEPGSWRRIPLKPELDRIVGRLIERLERTVHSPEWGQDDHKALVRRSISQVFRSHFRAQPVEETIRIAVREVLRRLPSDGGLKGIPRFEDDAKDAWARALGSDAMLS